MSTTTRQLCKDEIEIEIIKLKIEIVKWEARKREAPDAPQEGSEFYKSEFRYTESSETIERRRKKNEQAKALQASLTRVSRDECAELIKKHLLNEEFSYADLRRVSGDPKLYPSQALRQLQKTEHIVLVHQGHKGTDDLNRYRATSNLR